MFYDHLTEQYNALRAEQEAGSCVFHLLVGEDGTVLGRFKQQPPTTTSHRWAVARTRDTPAARCASCAARDQPGPGLIFEV